MSIAYALAKPTYYWTESGLPVSTGISAKKNPGSHGASRSRRNCPEFGAPKNQPSYLGGVVLAGAVVVAFLPFLPPFLWCFLPFFVVPG